MIATELHPDEAPMSVELARRLIEAQFPYWSGHAVRAWECLGTTNRIYRIGDRHAARFPRTAAAQAAIERELDWLPRLSPHLTIRIPEPVGRGRPGPDFPYLWSVCRWIEGEPAGVDTRSTPEADAETLARFIGELHRLDTTGAPISERARPLATRDEATRAAVDQLGDRIDRVLVLDRWAEALDTPPWPGPPRWVHGDLLAANLLARDGRLDAVLDFGGLGVGDPACDLLVAWSLLDRAGRASFRRRLDLDDATWRRGRGHALAQSLLFIPYYSGRHEPGVRAAWRQLHEVLADAE